MSGSQSTLRQAAGGAKRVVGYVGALIAFGLIVLVVAALILSLLMTMGAVIGFSVAALYNDLLGASLDTTTWAALGSLLVVVGVLTGSGSGSE